MLFEVKFYYKNGSTSHDLINCERHEDWSDKNELSTLTNIDKRIKFEANAFPSNPIVKVKKRCILACKTFLKDGATRKMFNC